jgi:FkbM family methyltransferase
MFIHVRRRLAFFTWCAKTFSSFTDVSAAMRLSNNKTEQSESKIALHPRALGGKTIYCRPGTTDWVTLRSVIEEQYHLPPVECNHLSCIVDLGANVGYTVAHFAYLYPDSRIIAVEMDQGNYELAKENILHWRERIMLIHAAIWSSNSEVAYDCDALQDAYKIKANSSESHISTQTDNHLKVVSAMSMDRLIEQFNIKHIDYLKVDIEGAEKELFLSSSLDWLSRVTALKVEVHRPQDMDMYHKALVAAGFITYKDDHHWSTVVAFRRPPLDVENLVI